MIQLPDFDEMDRLAEQAASARAQIKGLERVEEMFAASYMREALLDKDNWINGRPPNQVVLSKVVAKIGITDDHKKQMTALKDQISDAYSRYVEAVEKLQTCRDRISVFQTESANRRFASA
jgi:hypothetical protein